MIQTAMWVNEIERKSKDTDRTKMKKMETTL
jgi:hypothetical protein